MSIRSICSLGLMAFSRPLSILARPLHVPRVTAASARLGLHIHTRLNKPFHSSVQQLQRRQNKDAPDSKPSTENLLAPTNPESQPPQPQAPTDLEMERRIPSFSTLDVDAKLAHILALKSYLATEVQKNDPQWKPGAYEALTEGLARKEKEIRDADRWYRKAIRSIAWGPTILVNAVIALVWS